MAGRPYADRTALHAAAERCWGALSPAGWREAFAHHPRIGEAAGPRGSATAAWAGAEQAGATGADAATLAALAEGNRAYEARFGHVFLVCATGRGAAEMLALLRARLANEPAAELRVAAAEQAKITRLRLEKLLEEAP